MTPFDPDELARQAPFLRRLARRLVIDESRADDVEQEAWLAALQATEPPRNTGAWLARVARNAAIKMGRTDERRKRREAEVARPESFPGERVEQAAERAAVQRELTDALLSLEDPYRAVLLLRYFEDLPPRAIAVELGLPVATVHTRILRGRERLRRELTARKGDPSEWLPMLLQFSAEPNSAGSLPPISSGSGSLLRNGPIAAVGVGLAAVFGAVFFFGGSGETKEDVAQPGVQVQDELKEDEDSAEDTQDEAEEKEDTEDSVEFETGEGRRLPPRLEATNREEPRRERGTRRNPSRSNPPSSDPDGLLVASEGRAVENLIRAMETELRLGGSSTQADTAALLLQLRLLKQPYYKQPVGLVSIEGGSVFLGTPTKEIKRLIKENPELANTLVAEAPMEQVVVKPFAIQAVEVTNEQYAQFVTATGRPAPISFASKRAFDQAQQIFLENQAKQSPARRNRQGLQGAAEVDLPSFNPEEWWQSEEAQREWDLDETVAHKPVTHVTFGDAEAYAAWAGMRLPTEAEWVRAARGDAQRVYPWKKDSKSNVHERANIVESGHGRPRDVGSYSSAGAAMGLYDLAGNVWEWTSSAYASLDGYKPMRVKVGRGAQSRQVEALASWEPSFRILKGGSFQNLALAARVGTRMGALKAQATGGIGFRCVLSPEPNFALLRRFMGVWEDCLRQLPAPDQVALLERWAIARSRYSDRQITEFLIAEHNFIAFLPERDLEFGSRGLLEIKASAQGLPVGVLALSEGTGCVGLKPGTYRAVLRMQRVGPEEFPGVDLGIPHLVFLDQQGDARGASNLRFLPATSARRTTPASAVLQESPKHGTGMRTVRFSSSLRSVSGSVVPFEFDLLFDEQSLWGFPGQAR